MQKDHYHFVSCHLFSFLFRWGDRFVCLFVCLFVFFLPGGVRAHNGLFIHFTFETSSTFHLVAKNQSLPLLINTDVTPSIPIRLALLFHQANNGGKLHQENATIGNISKNTKVILPEKYKASNTDLMHVRHKCLLLLYLQPSCMYINVKLEQHQYHTKWIWSQPPPTEARIMVLNCNLTWSTEKQASAILRDCWNRLQRTWALWCVLVEVPPPRRGHNGHCIYF